MLAEGRLAPEVGKGDVLVLLNALSHVLESPPLSTFYLLSFSFSSFFPSSSSSLSLSLPLPISHIHTYPSCVSGEDAGKTAIPYNPQVSTDVNLANTV